MVPARRAPVSSPARNPLPARVLRHLHRCRPRERVPLLGSRFPCHLPRGSIRAGRRASIRARFGPGLIIRAGGLLAAPGNQLKDGGSGRSCAVGKNSFRLIRARCGQRARTAAPGTLVPARPCHRGHGVHPAIQQQTAMFIPGLARRGIRHLVPAGRNRHIEVAPPGIHIARIRGRFIRQFHGERYRRARTAFVIRHPHPQHIRSAGHRLVESGRDRSLGFRVLLRTRGRKFKRHHRADHNRERGKNPQPMLRLQTRENRSLFPNPALAARARRYRAAPASRSLALPASALAGTLLPGTFARRTLSSGSMACAFAGRALAGAFTSSALPSSPFPRAALPIDLLPA